MGLFRKIMSVGSAGAVDFRSDKERIARYTRQTRDETRDLARQQYGQPNAEDAGRLAEAEQQARDRVARERDRTSPVAQQERARREREKAELDRAAEEARRTRRRGK